MPPNQRKEKEVNQDKHQRKNIEGVDPDKTWPNFPHQEPTLEQRQQEGQGVEEQREPKRKKRKANKEANTFCIDEEEVETLAKVL